MRLRSVCLSGRDMTSPLRAARSRKCEGAAESATLEYQHHFES